MKRLLLATTAVAALTVSPMAAFAGSVLQPGGTIGLPAGAPLPEGVYFVDTSSYGQRSSGPAGQGVNLSQFIWATPFTAYDTRLQFIFLQPSVYTTHTAANHFFPNSTLFAAQFAHSFGNGFNASYQAGFRAGLDVAGVAAVFHDSSFEQRGAVTYNANGYDLTANVINGLFVGKSTTAYANWINVDLTATKTFDKWEIGGVAFGSSDISSPKVGYLRQRQIAAGGLVGYNFGSFKLQAFATRDVTEHHYVNNHNYDTRGWVRLILPLYKAPVAAPVVARY